MMNIIKVKKKKKKKKNFYFTINIICIDKKKLSNYINGILNLWGK
jgi:hypothetical protein